VKVFDHGETIQMLYISFDEWIMHPVALGCSETQTEKLKHNRVRIHSKEVKSDGILANFLLNELCRSLIGNMIPSMLSNLEDMILFR
jgi:hypothetical protein